MSRLTNILRTTLVVVTAATLWTACSKTEHNSLGPASPEALSGGSPTTRSSSTSVDLYGRVTAIDATSRTMQMSGQTATINVAQNAEIVFKDNGEETPISLSAIAPGDSIEVRGDFQNASSFLADRVRKRANDNAQETEFGGRVATIDAIVRTMTLTGRSELITVSPGAEIVKRAQGMETPITLADLQPGDSIEIRGVVHAGGVLADRVRLRAGHVEDGVNTEVELTDIITSIDYAAGTFSVAGHTDLVTTDSATIIFGDEHSGSERSTGAEASASDSIPSDDMSPKTRIDFANLNVGDTVEVHANRIDASTLYAVMVEVEDGAFENELEVEFKSTIASIDVANRVVTFAGASGMVSAIVAETADLRGLNNESLTLADFASGNIVEVKGFRNLDGTVEITRMDKDNTI